MLEIVGNWESVLILISLPLTDDRQDEAGGDGVSLGSRPRRHQQRGRLHDGSQPRKEDQATPTFRLLPP